MKGKKIKLSIDVDLIKDEEYFIIATPIKECENTLGHHICSQGKSLEEAEQKFWMMFKCMNEFHIQRSKQLDKYKFFDKGPWGSIGGNWFSVFGLHFNFRKTTKDRRPFMKGGLFIPFTNLNISFNNNWMKP